MRRPILDPACNAYMAVVQEAKLMPGEYIAVFGVGALGQFWHTGGESGRRCKDTGHRSESG